MPSKTRGIVASSDPEEEGSRRRPFGRRTLLRGGILGAGAAAVLGTGLSGAAAAAVPGASASAATPFQLFSQADLEFETLVVLGGAAYGVSELGEVVTAVNGINAAGATYQAYYDQFQAVARQVSQLASEELKAGHRASARGAYLRAAAYYDLCLYFVLATTARAQEAGAYSATHACWDQAARLFDPPFEPVRIPYEGSWLPGYLLKPDACDIRRPTVILNGGSDTTSIDMYVFGGAAALERGYNALIFDGPGQGSMLFQRQVPYRADWEKVITPVVDYLRGRPEVDPERIALLGLSMCGEAAVRAAAFEHRLAAVVPDPGVVNAWLAWPASIRGLFAGGATKAGVNHIWEQDIVPHLDPAERFTIAKRAELFDIQFMLAGRAGKTYPDLWDLGQAIMKVDCSSVAGQVTSPTLVTQYQDDTFYPGQGTELYGLLRCPKTLHEFTTAESGSEYHDAPMAPQTRNQVIYDWLDSLLASS
jgi:Esterase FrsA-like